jgi:hypothetical protein
VTPHTADKIDAKLRENPHQIEVIPTALLDQFFALRHAEALQDDDRWTYDNDSNASANAGSWYTRKMVQQAKSDLAYASERESWNVDVQTLYSTLILLGWNPPGYLPTPSA